MEKHAFRILLFISLVSVYLVPRSDYYKDLAFQIDLVSWFVIFICVLIISRKIKLYPINYLEFGALAVASFVPIFFGGSLNANFLFVIAACMIIKRNKPIEISNVSQYSIALFAICYYITHVADNGRHVLSNGDPNYTAYYLSLLGIFFAFQIRPKIFFGIALLFCALTTYSRAFILSVIAFSIYYILCRYNLFRLLRSGWLFLAVLTIIPFCISWAFLEAFGKPDLLYDTSSLRVLNYVDMSNYYRFMANFRFVDFLIENPINILSGTSAEDYLNGWFVNTPHNATLNTLFNYGLPYTIVLIIIITTFYKNLEKNPYVYGFIGYLMVWMTFLGVGMSGFQLIILAAVLVTLGCRNQESATCNRGDCED